MWGIFASSIVVALLSVLYIYMPSVFSPVLWGKQTKLLKLEGAAAPNNLLENAIKITGNFSGPEAIAFDAETGLAYVSFNDGTVGSFSETGEFLERVFFVGGFLANVAADKLYTNGLTDDAQNKELLDFCMTEALSDRLASNKEGLFKCGRPLGLRLKTISRVKLLFIMDTRHGLFTLNINSKEVQRLVTPKTPITAPIGVPYDSVSVSPIQFYNDLDITHDNTVIFTDSSYKYTVDEASHAISDSAPSGRLFQYDLKTRVLKPLVCGLHFPNGVQVLHEKRNIGTARDVEVIVAELTRNRLVKINVSHNSVQYGTFLGNCGEKGAFNQAISECLSDPSFDSPAKVFAELPGIPDNVRMDTTQYNKEGRGYYIVGMIGPSLTERYGLVVVLNQDGKIVSSLHDPTGNQVALLSHGEIHPTTGDMWLGSYFEHHVGILHKKYLPEKWEY